MPTCYAGFRVFGQLLSSVAGTMATDARHHKGRKRVNLALQGGGAHGAYTWGVLERLIADDRIFIDGLSGTSAGAMNAVVLADGFVRGRQKRATAALRTFWQQVSEGAFVPMAMTNALSPMHGSWNMDDAPGYQMLDAISRMFSPYQLNPLNLHPLRDILSALIDFDGLRRQANIKLFVAATNVRTCKLKVFRTAEITVDSLLASACLPMLFRAVEINGECYWDGGYMANPAIMPLVNECVSKDVIIVQVNPINRPQVPGTAREILNRVNEISFNSSLMREMNGISTVSRLIRQGHAQGTGFTPVHFHMIEAEDAMSELGSSSKFNADWKFLTYLHELGMATAERWLADHFDALGNESTLDMIKTYE
ncbi:MAG: Acyl transferase/acyl hydrolase/lysophospholipase [Betaproteobacteria bacterium]|nr:Acyl transferase/acyl hydrolase/lysophospholipase [Betaproteobacteria bacterium]